MGLGHTSAESTAFPDALKTETHGTRAHWYRESGNGIEARTITSSVVLGSAIPSTEYSNYMDDPKQAQRMRGGAVLKTCVQEWCGRKLTGVSMMTAIPENLATIAPRLVPATQSTTTATHAPRKFSIQPCTALSMVWSIRSTGTQKEGRAIIVPQGDGKAIELVVLFARRTTCVLQECDLEFVYPPDPLCVYAFVIFQAIDS
ncbi:hypothetical protein NMY22_g200 [Coprinellus aureogranulatus]|nr:hypothetical protein NMY22_g200 [Coprinellus aureogranulatus]